VSQRIAEVIAALLLAAAPLWSPPAEGTYGVGYVSLYRHDPARSLVATDGRLVQRPVRIDVWYPAGKPAAQRIRFADYVSASARDVDFAAPITDDVRQRFLRERGEAAATLFDQPMLATQAPPPAKGRFPLVLYAHTNTSSKCFLAEFLASRGYVVMAPQIVGTWEAPLDVALSGIETQTRDLEFVLGTAATKPYVDMSRVGVIGMSFGGLTALSLAMRNAAIDAVVSLDGGIGSASNVENFGFARGPFHDVPRFTKPLLHLYSATSPGTDLAYLSTLEYSERWMVSAPALTHEDFGSPLRILRSPQLSSFNAVADVVAAFLDAHLRSSDVFDATLQRHRDLLTSERRSGRPAPPTATELLLIAKREGIEALRQRHRDLQALDPHPIPTSTYRSMVFTALELDGNLALARDLAEMYATDYPQSSRAALTLGNIELRLSRKAEAEAAFQRAVDLSSGDPFLDANQRRQVASAAAARLEALRKTQ
jgi:dienelactone hydrolase